MLLKCAENPPALAVGRRQRFKEEITIRKRQRNNKTSLNLSSYFLSNFLYIRCKSNIIVLILMIYLFQIFLEVVVL